MDREDKRRVLRRMRWRTDGHGDSGLRKSEVLETGVELEQALAPAPGPCVLLSRQIASQDKVRGKNELTTT